jgi:hypothetical protein
MRTASDFDRPYPGSSAAYNLFHANQWRFESATKNICHAGIKVVKSILNGWDATFGPGATSHNCIGDIFGTPGGQPDFGPGRTQDLLEGGMLNKRSMRGRPRRGG